MEPADVVLVGEGFQLDESASSPKGVVYSGGYDAEMNKVFLASVVGHPGGMAAAGGDPSKDCVSGLRALLVDSGEVYWASDSMSLPRKLNDAERSAVQLGLETAFAGRKVVEVDQLQGVPR